MATSKIWARSLSSKAECIHVWTIDNFSLRDKEMISKFTNDDDGKTKSNWELRLQPSEAVYISNYKCEYFLSSSLKLIISRYEPVKQSPPRYVNVSILLRDGNGKLLTNCGYPATRDNNDYLWKFPNILKRNDVLLTKLPNDELIIEFKLNYLVEALETKVISQSQLLPDPKCDLSDHLGVLLIDEKLSDLTIFVGESEFRAHVNILSARSPFFAAMFEHDMKEKRENRVQLREIKPEIFKEVLAYIYTGKLASEKMTESVAKDLLAAGDRFAIGRLKTLAENFLISKVTMGNAQELLDFAEKYSAENLKTTAKNYFTTVK